MTEPTQSDFIFVECDADHAFEKTENNNRWINRIDGGVTIPENSKLSVQYAGINIIGSGTDVVEFKGLKIGESAIYEYNESTEEYQLVLYDVFDNKVTVVLQFYKNQDGLYNFPTGYPHYDFNASIYNTNYSSIDNVWADATDEIEFGITSSTYKSQYNFTFPIDNKRYTIMTRNSFSIFPADTNKGREYGGVDFAPRSPSTYEYSIYNNKVEIKLDKGFISPSSISEQISQQLEKHSEPKIKTFRCWSEKPNAPALSWTGYKDIEGALTCETETFKLFKCATRRKLWELGYRNFNDATIANNDVEVQHYQDVYENIAVYNPDVFTTGRLIEKRQDYYNKQKINVFVEQIDCSAITTNQPKEYTMYTNIPWDENILIQYKYLFDYIEADSELYQNRVAIETGSTPTNSIFLHTEPQRNKYGSLDAFKQSPFGTDYSVTAENTKISNPLYLTRNQEYKNDFMEDLAYGVFSPWRTDDGKFYCSVQGRFYIEMRVGVPIFKFYSNNSAFGGDSPILMKRNEYVVENFPISFLDYTRFSWDRHLNAQGNQSIILWNGLSDLSELSVNMTGDHAAAADEHPFSNSFILKGTEDNAEPTLYYYDTGNDEIYIGADSFLFNFDSTESRFNVSQLHTSRKQFNTALSGYDASVLQGVKSSTPGVIPIYYTKDSLKTSNDKVQFPLDINPNANTPIYEISPSELSTISQEVAELYKILKANTIFDSNCGIFMASFGVDDASFEGSLWDILGFSSEQTKTYMTKNIYNHDVLYRNHRFLTSGVNIIDVVKYPFTTNAQINSNEIISWRTNPFSVSYFNTLNIPNNIRNIQDASGPSKWIYQQPSQPYRVTQNQLSTQMFAEILPQKTDIPFYQVRSDILPPLKYYGGNNQSSGKLPVMAIVNKSFAGTDFFVNQGDNSMSYIVKKTITLNNIVTEIFDNYGRPALLDKHSSIIYRFEIPYTPPLVTPFNSLGEAEAAEAQARLKKK